MSLSERTASDYAIEHAVYLARSVTAFLDLIGREAVFDEDAQQHLREEVSDHLQAMRSGVYEFEKRAARAEGALARAGDGWVYHNPDVGTEYAPNHPVASGEVPDATDVRASTLFEDWLIRELAVNRAVADPASQQLTAVLRKFVDFEDRYDADKTVSDDEVRAATAEAKALLEGKAP